METMLRRWTLPRSIRRFALQCLERAELLDAERTESESFDLEGYVRTGHVHIRESGEPIQLVARLHPDAANHLAETLLTADQTRGKPTTVESRSR